MKPVSGTNRGVFLSRMIGLWSLWPPFWGQGIKVRKVGPDFTWIKAELVLRPWTKNLHGTAFGGAMFAMTDPLLVALLTAQLGKDYVVWDKKATISYLRPGRTRLSAVANVSTLEVANIREYLNTNEKMSWEKTIEIKDSHGVVVATVEKVVSIKKLQVV